MCGLDLDMLLLLSLWCALDESLPADVLLLPLLLMRLAFTVAEDEDVAAATLLGLSLPSVRTMTGWFIKPPPDDRGPLEEMGRWRRT